MVRFCCRHAVPTVVAGLLLALGASIYVSQHFEMDSNSENLISPDVDWRQRQMAFDKEFPQRINLTLVVIDGATPERAEEAATALKAALSEHKDLFPAVRDIEGSDFFAHNGLLFLSLDEVRDTTRHVIDAQPFLGPLAADSSLRGIVDGFSAALLGVENDATKLEDLARPFTVFSGVLEDVNAGRSTFLSWQNLITGETPTTRETRRLIEVQAALDFNALASGARASNTIRNLASELELTPANGVTLRLTGPVPIADEEFLSLTDRAVLMAVLMMSAILLTLWAAVRSAKIVAAILITLFAGLAITTAIGLAAIGQFNVISVAFIPLFVGIGVDFGIQYSVRFRAERLEHRGLEPGLMQAGAIMGPPLTLAATATAACFYSFMPTSFSGVAELGFIAGNGMLIAYVLNGTLLPALLKLMNPKEEAREIGFASLAPADRFLYRQRRAIVIAFGVFTAGGLLLMPYLTFDANPFDLRSKTTESMATLYDLMKDPETSPNTIEILTPSLADARALATRIEQLPDVDHATTLESFIPESQTEKIALISDAALLLDTTLNPFDMKPAPSREETLASIAVTRDKLRKVAGTETTPAAEAARRMAGQLEMLAKADGATLARAEAALVPGLKTMLTRLRASLDPAPVDLNRVPTDLTREWLAPDGRARVQVSVKGDPNDNGLLRRFADDVRRIAPDATGAPISTAESGRTIVNAFIEAGLLSLAAVVILLMIALKSMRDVILTLGPLLAACILTFATCVILGLPLNFANIIVLPLLLGIGVAFHIYFVMAWREGGHNFLQSSLSRAVLFSALTTATGFGTLWLSNHPGTSSMGELLMISLAWTLMILILLPALLETAKAR
jgi:hypothetical protein